MCKFSPSFIISTLSVGKLRMAAVPRHDLPMSVKDIQIDGAAAGLGIGSSGPRGILSAFLVQGPVEATSAALRWGRSGSSFLLHTTALANRQTQLEE